MSELFFVVSLVTMIQSGKPVGTATGFFYEKNDSLYFVTNRHVVVDESKGVKPDILRVRLHTNPDDLTKNADRDVPLYDKGKAKWHVHKEYASKAIDIAVIEIDAKALTSGTFIKVLSASNFLPAEFLINPGEDVMVIGFPRGLSDSLHNLPLTRSALISSAYGIDFEGRQMFLVDSNLHPGMSGSPVMTRPKNVWADKKGNTNLLTGSPTYFVGIFSATLSVNVTATQQEALGLGAVWYARLIEEIIASM
ncbi:trypsin-like peptidase domain-containing protein [Nitrospira defluvii]|nr:trypsin-like peptidase domain-containing protein [Nitrospira defluvii]